MHGSLPPSEQAKVRREYTHSIHTGLERPAAEEAEPRLSCPLPPRKPLHGRRSSGCPLPQVFLDAPKGVTKIVLATNVAEASVTINHVALVIDGGRVKRMAYDGARGVSSLQVRSPPELPVSPP